MDAVRKRNWVFIDCKGCHIQRYVISKYFNSNLTLLRLIKKLAFGLWGSALLRPLVFYFTEMFSSQQKINYPNELKLLHIYLTLQIYAFSITILNALLDQIETLFCKYYPFNTWCGPFYPHLYWHARLRFTKRFIILILRTNFNTNHTVYFLKLRLCPTFLKI